MKRLAERIALVAWLLAAALLTGVSPVSAEATAGHYVRRNANGAVNAQMNVIVLPGIGPVISVTACDYQGSEELMADGWRERPVIRLGGTIQAAQAGYGARFVIGALTTPRPDRSLATAEIPIRMLPSCEAVTEPRRITLRSHSPWREGPDAAGVYEFAGLTPSPDGYKAFALLEWLPSRETGVTPWTMAYRYEIQELDGRERSARDYYPSLGMDVGGYDIRVYDRASGALQAAFVIPYFLEAVYRVAPEGQVTVIWQAEEPKG